MRNFQILIVFAVKICKHVGKLFQLLWRLCPQPRPPTGTSPLDPGLVGYIRLKRTIPGARRHCQRPVSWELSSQLSCPQFDSVEGVCSRHPGGDAQTPSSILSLGIDGSSFIVGSFIHSFIHSLYEWKWTTRHVVALHITNYTRHSKLLPILPLPLGIRTFQFNYTRVYLKSMTVVHTALRAEQAHAASQRAMPTDNHRHTDKKTSVL